MRPEGVLSPPRGLTELGPSEPRPASRRATPFVESRWGGSLRVIAHPYHPGPCDAEQPEQPGDSAHCGHVRGSQIQPA